MPGSPAAQLVPASVTVLSGPQHGSAAVDPSTGKITYTIADSKNGMNFLVFLVALVKAYAGRKIRLVCDNGRFHHTRAVQEWLAANSDRITIYWLPP